MAKLYSSFAELWVEPKDLFRPCSDPEFDDHILQKIREKFIHIPGKVVKHARQYFLRIPVKFREEVQAMTTGWAGALEAALAMS